MVSTFPASLPSGISTLIAPLEFRLHQKAWLHSDRPDPLIIFSYLKGIRDNKHC